MGFDSEIWSKQQICIVAFIEFYSSNFGNTFCVFVFVIIGNVCGGAFLAFHFYTSGSVDMNNNRIQKSWQKYKYQPCVRCFFVVSLIIVTALQVKCSNTKSKYKFQLRKNVLKFVQKVNCTHQVFNFIFSILISS